MSEPSSSTTAPKAIGSLAKKQSDVTRQGTQKLKFVPTLPQRRKKEDVKAEPTAAVIPPSSTERGRGRGRGRGDARGRGRGRGAPPVVEMTASGPFAMGPALAGSTSRRAAPRSNFVPSVPTEGSSDLGGNLSQSAPPSLRKDHGLSAKNGPVKDEEEVYSDPDEGVEIVDMENVRQMDWMAPESIRKERQQAKKIKKEEAADDLTTGDADAGNALNLSESEEEEELEDIIEDFATQTNIDSDEAMREERLYFFQFPSPFPEFTSKKEVAMDVDPVPVLGVAGKKVSFAADVKADITPGSSRTASAVPSEAESAKAAPLDGVIGQLEVYKSGAVKIRLANGILLDVNAATQPSFLQQAMYLNKAEKQITVLGEVNKQFVVSPNVDALLTALEKEEASASIMEGEEKLLTMA